MVFHQQQQAEAEDMVEDLDLQLAMEMNERRILVKPNLSSVF